MRSVVLGLGISLDGYIARPDGGVDFLFIPTDYSMADFFSSLDAAILVGKSYDNSREMGGGSYGPSLKTYVFSRTLPPGDREGLTFVNQDLYSFVHELRKHPGKDMWLMGGGELARDSLEEDLLDKLYLGIVPVLLGEDIPLFPPGFPQRNFSLRENKTFSRGLIALKYKRLRSKPKRKP